MEDYEKEYNDFWKDIVENEDGTLNKDQVMRELYDYSNINNNIQANIINTIIICKTKIIYELR